MRVMVSAGSRGIKTWLIREDPVVPTFTLYTLGASDISISNGVSLSGGNQGSGVQLLNQTITLNTNQWEAVDVFDSEANFEDSDATQTLDGAQTYDGVAYANGLRVEAEYTLTLTDPDGNTYTAIGFNINEVGGANTYGTVEGLAFIGGVGGFPPVGVPLTVTGTSEGPAGATTPYSSYATPPCFTKGTLIDTDRGQVAVDALRIGDFVRTLDDGMQPIRWIGQIDIAPRDLWIQDRLRPVRIAAGALGQGLPVREMCVSPMHRILWGDVRTALLFGDEEVLVPALHLVGQPGITRDDTLRPVSYYHIAFDDHHVVCSEGAWSESFLPGAQTIEGMEASVQSELDRLFGEADMTSARLCLKRYEAEVLLAA